MKRIHALAGTVLALSVLSFAGCANDASTVEMAAASTINNRPENKEVVLNTSVKTVVEALKDYNSLGLNNDFFITGDLSAADFAALKDSLKALPSLQYDGTDKYVGLIFGNANFPGNALPDSAFNDCAHLNGILLPPNLTKIGNWAVNSTSIQSIIIPPGVKKIGTNAFAWTPLGSVVIPEGVTSLSGTFNECWNLQSVTIPASVTAFKDVPDSNDTEDGAWGTFKNCWNLSAVNFSGTKAQWNNISKGPLTFKNSGVYKVNCSDGEIWLGATSSVSSVADAVTTIQNMTQPTKIAISANIAYDFTTLKNAIKAAAANVYLDLSAATVEGNKIPNDAFNGCGKLVGVVLPNDITKIGAHAFKNTKLTSVVIPDSVTSFGGAFNNISTLTTATIGSGVTSLEDGASYGCFERCYALTNVTYKGTKAQWEALSSTKGYFFKNGVPATTIHCSDGDTTF